MGFAGWPTLPLNDVVRLKRGFDLPTSRRTSGDVPVVGSAGISGWHNKVMVKGPGVVVGRAGSSMGVATYVEQDFWPLNTALFVEDFCGNDPRFVYALLHSIDFTGYNSGAAHPMLNRNYIKAIPVALPDFSEQCAIADMLGALDTKIAVNEQFARTSRSLAEARFESVLALSGPHCISIDDVTSLLTRGMAPKYVEPAHGMIIVNQKCVRGGRVDLISARYTSVESVKTERFLQEGDMLVNSTGVGTLGRVARWDHRRDATVDSHVTIVRFNPSRVDPILGAFAMLAAQSRIEALGEGSTGQTELSRAKLGRVRLDMPTSGHTSELVRVLTELEVTGRAKLQENRILAELRDTLMPKLMSGEIRVKDAERVVVDAV